MHYAVYKALQKPSTLALAFYCISALMNKANLQLLYFKFSSVKLRYWVGIPDETSSV